MNEQTKIYIVSFNDGIYPVSSPREFYLSKEEAEFRAYKLNREADTLSSPYFALSDYSVKEIPAGQIQQKDKSYKEFIKSRIEEIEKEIKSKQECSEKDNTSISELQPRLDYYKGLL